MKLKYNLALIPQSKAEEVIRFAQKFSGLADRYLLGKNSNPHVTLYQFEREESEIDMLWLDIKEAWKEQPIKLVFDNWSYKPFDALYWVSLMPDQNERLHQMHQRIAKLIHCAVKKSFEPHMTLINTKNKDNEAKAQQIFTAYETMADTFILCLGRSDEVGQLTEILHKISNNA